MQIHILMNIIEKTECKDLWFWLCFLDMEDTDNTTCNVDGKVYKAGEYFYPNANPKLLCMCMEGYAGIIWKKSWNVCNEVIGI